jgi:GNAT superfamily N-acetyltransferase
MATSTVAPAVGPSDGAAPPPPPSGYVFQRLDTPIAPELADEITSVLAGFGPHFAAVFGRDYRARLIGDASTQAVAIYIARVVSEEGDDGKGELVAHAGVLYNRAQPTVGALFNVFTVEAHRRRGLSTPLVHGALAAFDAVGGKVCVLGTGSAHAAKMYSREGFVRIAGGLAGSGPKGYNPGDGCEHIMQRSTMATPFAAVDHYALAEGAEFEVEVADRRHFADLALLFFVNEGAGTLDILGISHGVLAEEPLTALACDIEAGKFSATVAVAKTPGGAQRVHGIRVQSCADSAAISTYVYPGPAAVQAAAALASK